MNVAKGTLKKGPMAPFSNPPILVKNLARETFARGFSEVTQDLTVAVARYAIQPFKPNRSSAVRDSAHFERAARRRPNSSDFRNLA